MSLPPPLKKMLVEASAISKKYVRKGGPALDVLSQVNISIESGDKIAILGKSGSGKSTLLHILGTLDKPSSGSLLFLGQNILQSSEEQIAKFRNEKMGFVFQFHYLMVEFSALENVMMPLLIAGRSRREAAARAEMLLARVGLKDRIHHRPSQLSGGEQSRVAIARALANQPVLLLTDEMTGNLDAETARHIFDLIQALHEEYRMALVSVTHDQAMANEYQKVFTLERGKLVSRQSL